MVTAAAATLLQLASFKILGAIVFNTLCNTDLYTRCSYHMAYGDRRHCTLAIRLLLSLSVILLDSLCTPSDTLCCFAASAAPTLVCKVPIVKAILLVSVLHMLNAFAGIFEDWMALCKLLTSRPERGDSGLAGVT